MPAYREPQKIDVSDVPQDRKEGRPVTGRPDALRHYLRTIDVKNLPVP